MDPAPPPSDQPGPRTTSDKPRTTGTRDTDGAKANTDRGQLQKLWRLFHEVVKTTPPDKWFKSELKFS